MLQISTMLDSLFYFINVQADIISILNLQHARSLIRISRYRHTPFILPGESFVEDDVASIATLHRFKH